MTAAVDQILTMRRMIIIIMMRIMIMIMVDEMVTIRRMIRILMIMIILFMRCPQ